MHSLKDIRGVLFCSVVRAYIVPHSQATGDNAHTVKYFFINSVDKKLGRSDEGGQHGRESSRGPIRVTSKLLIKIRQNEEIRIRGGWMGKGRFGRKQNGAGKTWVKCWRIS